MSSKRHLRCMAILLIGVAAGHAQAAPPAIDAALPPPQMAGVAIPPGQIAAAIVELDGVAAAIMRRTGIPGMAIAVVRDGKTVYAKGFGVRRSGAADKVDADTVFQLASLSKPVGATVVAREVGLHVVAWDTPVVQHLPWFALGDPWVTQHVTIGDLYAHRSGLPDHAGDDLEDVGFGQRQILERLRALPLHPFRADYAYTNFGLTAAALSVAAAAGIDWADLSEAAIYKPLGMTATSSRFADFEHRPDRAVNHARIGGVFQPKYQRQPDAQSPAGGVSSSARDMARWMAMVLQGGVYDGQRIVAQNALLPAVTAEMISGPTGTVAARPNLYGFGFNVGTQPTGRVTLSHSGAFAMGAGTTFTLIPSASVGIVVLSNASPVGAVEAVAASFVDLVQFGSVTRDWLAAYGPLLLSQSAPFGALSGKTPPANAAPAAALGAYAGAYTNDYAGDAVVARQGDALVLKLGPQGTANPLRHWDGNVFVYTPTGENAPDGSVATATFTLDGAGRASSVALEWFAADGRAEFPRRPD